jgi:hypothetical protein
MTVPLRLTGSFPSSGQAALLLSARPIYISPPRHCPPVALGRLTNACAGGCSQPMTSRLNTRSVALSCALVAFGLCAAEPPAQPSAAAPTAGKSYQIRNKHLGDLLRPQEANSADGTPMVLYSAQPWKCMTWKLSSAGESRFYLQNHFTSKTFAPAGQAAQEPRAVTQVPLSGKPEKRPSWQFTKLSDGSYKIADPATGKVLTAEKNANGSGFKIVAREWTNSEDQKWELVEIDPKTLTM